MNSIHSHLYYFDKLNRAIATDMRCLQISARILKAVYLFCESGSVHSCQILQTRTILQKYSTEAHSLHVTTPMSRFKPMNSVYSIWIFQVKREVCDCSLTAGDSVTVPGVSCFHVE